MRQFAGDWSGVTRSDTGEGEQMIREPHPIVREILRTASHCHPQHDHAY